MPDVRILIKEENPLGRVDTEVLVGFAVRLPGGKGV